MRVWLLLAVLTSWLVSATGNAVAATDEPVVMAAAAIALDAKTGEVLYAKDADQPRAPASLTKLATALTAVDLAPLDTTLRVQASDLVGEASMGLRPGDELTLETALYGLLLASGNDAAMTIARNLSALPGESPDASVARFVRQMNLVVQRLGLQRTTFRNPHGLDEAGHVSSARDLALLTRAVLQRPELRRILATPSYADGRYAVETTNRLLGRYPGLIGGKTGITDAAGYSLIEAAHRDGHTVIVVVLGSTRDAWYDDAVRLLDYAFERLVRGARHAEPGAGTGTVASPSVITPAVEGSTASRALLVRLPTADARSEQLWFWPASALTAVVVIGVLVTSLPIVTASLVARRPRPARSRHRPASAGRAVVRRDRERPGHRRGVTTGHDRGRLVTRERPASAGLVRFDAALAVAQRAVRAGRRGDFVVAEEEFINALRINPAFDLARTPEFWTLSPTGVVAAARAYRRFGRVRDARTLLTVAQLSFGDVPAIRQALAELPHGWVAVTASVSADRCTPHH
ncbi:MAG: D-alanyl-D-alanine carboxypeptidase [Thermomicrobium sp.]|nr:D-alanyl-D-alanine carboxypeptidase [Thermomicrobium sp.]MDW7982840.1 D-alanyl-D-alanine carboxypeptidase family protein [Thermomicrobium sp.]